MNSKLRNHNYSSAHNYKVKMQKEQIEGQETYRITEINPTSNSVSNKPNQLVKDSMRGP